MDANSARTENMRRLVADAGGPAEWVRQYGGTRWQQPQVSQWISETSPKGIGRRLARDLETAMGLTSGELDRPLIEHGYTRIDAEILTAAHRLMQVVAEIRGEHPVPSIDIKRLALAYETIRHFPAPISEVSTIDAMKAFAAKLETYSGQS